MRKMLFKRRLVILSFFLAFCFISSAQGISLNFSQKNLKTVLEEVSQQSGYSLAYSKEVVNLEDVVTIKVSDAKLSDVLNELLLSRNLKYEVRDNKIYILHKSAATATQADASQQNQHKEVAIKGVVTDREGVPVIGANVSIPGTTTGTITDIDGQYTLSVPRGSVLRFSYIGYNNQDVRITNQATVNVTLTEDVEMLDELVVVGYGVQKKSVVTAAISRVSAEELNTNRPSRVEDALKGKVSGVQITQSSGQPGSDSKFRIRGVGTVNNSEPLFIVDGMEVGGGINYLNPVDIQSIEILKDAASSAIYGARGANGVVLVTTKSGEAGKVQVNYDMSYGWQNPWKHKEVLNAQEYMVIMNESDINDGNRPRFSNDQISSIGKVNRLSAEI